MTTYTVGAGILGFNMIKGKLPLLNFLISNFKVLILMKRLLSISLYFLQVDIEA